MSIGRANSAAIANFLILAAGHGILSTALGMAQGADTPGVIFIVFVAFVGFAVLALGALTLLVRALLRDRSRLLHRLLPSLGIGGLELWLFAERPAAGWPIGVCIVVFLLGLAASALGEWHTVSGGPSRTVR